MLVKMFGKMWRIIGTDPTSGEPIYEPVADAPAVVLPPVAVTPLAPAPTPIAPPPFAPQPVAKKSVAQSRKPAAIPEVIGAQVKKGKSLTPTSDRDGGPKRRPDGSIIPPDSGLAGCQCQIPCFCLNPDGYLTPWMRTREDSVEAEAEFGAGIDSSVSGVLDTDLRKVGKAYVSDTTEAVIVSRFGQMMKMTGYDKDTGEATYVEATAAEIEAAGGNIVRIEGNSGPAITGNFGFAGGTDASGGECKTERIPLDFKRYGISARPGSYGGTASMSAEQVANYRRGVEEIDKELTDDERQLGRDLAGDND